MKPEQRLGNAFFLYLTPSPQTQCLGLSWIQPWTWAELEREGLWDRLPPVFQPPQTPPGMPYAGQESDVLLPKSRTYLRIKLLIWGYVFTLHLAGTTSLRNPLGFKEFQEFGGPLCLGRAWGRAEMWPGVWEIEPGETCGLKLTRPINKGCLCVFVWLTSKKRYILLLNLK